MVSREHENRSVASPNYHTFDPTDKICGKLVHTTDQITFRITSKPLIDSWMGTHVQYETDRRQHVSQDDSQQHTADYTRESNNYMRTFLSAR